MQGASDEVVMQHRDSEPRTVRRALPQRAPLVRVGVRAKRSDMDVS